MSSGRGVLSRFFPVNSSISRALVPGLIRARFSPNGITGLSLLAGIAAGCLLALGTPAAALGGASWFLISNVLDECDGKVARQTNRASPLGALFDTLTDCAVHVAFFLGLGIGTARQFPGGPWFLLGAVAAGGSLLSCILDVGGAAPWQPPGFSGGDKRDLLAWVAEWFRIDFSLLVVVSAALRCMTWILWAGALGVFLFWIPSMFLIAARGTR